MTLAEKACGLSPGEGAADPNTTQLMNRLGGGLAVTQVPRDIFAEL